MKNFRYLFILVFFFLIFPQSSLAKPNENTTKVLFIGNSYTYYHSMPQLFRAMAEHRFPEHKIETKFVGNGGATLKQHWEEGTAYREIQSGEWNFVILQEQSMLGETVFEDGKSYVRSPDLFFEYARKFIDHIQKNRAKAVLYMTWSRKNRPDQQKYLTYAYMSIANETKSLVVPVGMIWDSLRTNEAFDLYEFDGSHPSVYGSYTAALMIFSVLFDADPTGIPGRLEGYEILRRGRISETKHLLCDLLKRNVKIIQQEASSVYDRMKTNGGYLDVEKAVSDKKPSKVTIFFEYASKLEGQMVMLGIIIMLMILVKGSIFLIRR